MLIDRLARRPTGTNCFAVRSVLVLSVLVLAVLLAACSQPDGGAEGMVLIPGGTFRMGIEHPMMPEAQPLHPVRVDDFYLDKTPVTNRQFKGFVEQTGYITVAEEPLNPADFPDADPHLLVPGSIVFKSPSQPVPLSNELQWWQYVPGASWRHPEGPDSDIEERLDHPVVHIAWRDAAAYARWANKRLPTEAEWEYAARGGLDGREFAWGDDMKPAGKHMANTFQGSFPHDNRGDDGYRATSPVNAYPPNGYDLYDMSGNVWEWMSDWYHPEEYARRSAEGVPVDNPVGPPAEQAERGYKVQKGGSFLCTDQYCARFRPGARGRGDPESSSNHVGFRLARDVQG